MKTDIPVLPLYFGSNLQVECFALTQPQDDVEIGQNIFGG